jgi:hypothetical protein
MKIIFETDDGAQFPFDVTGPAQLADLLKQQYGVVDGNRASLTNYANMFIGELKNLDLPLKVEAYICRGLIIPPDTDPAHLHQANWFKKDGLYLSFDAWAREALRSPYYFAGWKGFGKLSQQVLREKLSEYLKRSTEIG